MTSILFAFIVGLAMRDRWPLVLQRQSQRLQLEDRETKRKRGRRSR